MNYAFSTKKNNKNMHVQGHQEILCNCRPLWGPFKGPKSNFNPVHFALHFKQFSLMVLKWILASKLSELGQFENRAAKNQLASKCVKMRPKSNPCNWQALETVYYGSLRNETPLKIQASLEMALVWFLPHFHSFPCYLVIFCPIFKLL